MKVAHIVPTAYKNPSEGYIMLLAHLMDNEEYVKNNLRNRKKAYIIMDNSIIELGSAMTIQRLCDLGEEHKVNEIVLPDVFLNSKDTINSVREALSYVRSRYANQPPFKLMAVPQGNTVEEWLECYETISAMKVDTIGIPKVLDRMKGGRAYVVGVIGRDPARGHEYHLLGSHVGLVDIEYYASMHPWVRGLDSCMAYIVARDYRDDDLSTMNLFAIPRPEATINFKDREDNKIKQQLNYIVNSCEVLL